MSKPKLTYFDAPVSRGEECRLAFQLAGVDFEDNRIKGHDWPAAKLAAPFGAVPVLEMPGHAPLAQSNAILTLIGRLHNLHPADLFEAARHEAMMQYVEDLRAAISPTMRMSDEAGKKAAREVIATSTLPTWAKNAEQQIGDGPFFGGAAIHVVDLKIYMVLRWLLSGAIDHIPAATVAPFPKLNRIHDAVRDNAVVKAWNAKF